MPRATCPNEIGHFDLSSYWDDGRDHPPAHVFDAAEAIQARVDVPRVGIIPAGEDDQRVPQVGFRAILLHDGAQAQVLLLDQRRVIVIDQRRDPAGMIVDVPWS